MPPPASSYHHLGPFSDLVDVAHSSRQLFPEAPPGPDTQRKVQQVLGFGMRDAQASAIRLERQWKVPGLVGEEVSWSVGFGPRTHAFVLRPEGPGPFPGVLALHDHGHFKFLGKEKIVDGPEGPLPCLSAFRANYYGGRAYANELARRGFVVVANDVFLWGSRRFPLDVMPEAERTLACHVGDILDQQDAGPEITGYNGAAYLHEHLISKYCTVLGTSFAAIVAYEDRCALAYLRSRPEVDSARVGCLGLSGGGARAALLRATARELAACAIAGMMSTYEDLLDRSVAPHTWMLFPPGWSTQGDWPDLAASGAPSPLLVHYLLDDAQFTVNGMKAADRRIAGHYARAGAQDAYVGEFYPGPHRFDLDMQEHAFAWLGPHLTALE
jgi:dienelactone hydrolase